MENKTLKYKGAGRVTKHRKSDTYDGGQVFAFSIAEREKRIAHMAQRQDYGLDLFTGKPLTVEDRMTVEVDDSEAASTRLFINNTG